MKSSSGQEAPEQDHRIPRDAAEVDTLCHRIPNFIEKAAQAGLRRVFIGLENINPDNLTAHTTLTTLLWCKLVTMFEASTPSKTGPSAASCGEIAAMACRWRALSVLPALCR